MPAPQPLLGRTLVERCTGASGNVARLSIAFAGRIAADLGAEVIAISADGNDPLQKWGPVLPDGSTSVARFLNHRKSVSATAPSDKADLLTDDPELAGNWGAGVAVLVSSSGAASGPTSELTILAASGLLDIFGETGRAPLPMPGNQIAYSAGVAAFDALISGVFAETFSGKHARSDVKVIDVAEWLNWKLFLAAYFEQFEAGIGRAEDWAAVACTDGYIAVVFQDKDMPALTRLVGDSALASPKFATLAGRRENITEFNSIIASWACGRQRDDIVREARESRLPFGPVLTLSDLVDDRQMTSRSFVNLDSSSKHYGVARLPAVWVVAE